MKTIGIGFILIVCMVFGMGGHAGKSEGGKDPLAGTSWIESKGGSQWVFDEDKSFH